METFLVENFLVEVCSFFLDFDAKFSGLLSQEPAFGGATANNQNNNSNHRANELHA